jgi:hypothetical protein
MVRIGWSMFLLPGLLLAWGCDNPDAARIHASPASRTSAAGTANADPPDFGILFVGNSHTAGDLTQFVGDMIRSQNPQKTLATQVIPVAFLDDLARDPSCRKEIETGKWKYLILQAQKISVSGKHSYSRKEGIDIAKFARARGIKVIFYPEWGLKGVAGDGKRQEKVYREMARDAGVDFAPVALAWDLALAEQPKLPLHGPDGNHQTQVGAFLTACVLYGTITGESPKRLASLDTPTPDEKVRTFLASMADKAIAQKEEPQTKP